MKAKPFIATAIVSLGFCASAQAQACPTQSFAITDQSGLPAKQLAKAERAISAQSLQVRKYWHTPCVTFGSGVPITITYNPSALTLGIHSYGQQTPYSIASLYIVVVRHHSYCLGPCYAGSDWTVTLSHEIFELLVNPYGTRCWLDGTAMEIADPVNGDAYTIHGIAVSNFVFPGWLTSRYGPWDFMNALQRKGQKT